MTAASTLQDAGDRARAATELGRNFAVEAGAGSGKTTIIVTRVVALVEAGARLDQLAAVTFTRAAAGELRSKMVEALDATRRRSVAEGDATRAARFAEALVALDSAYVGTIHGFCARLLRERPVEAGLDPDFREVEGAEWTGWVREWLRVRLDALAAEGDGTLAELRALRVSDEVLTEAFATMVDEADVTFDAALGALPDAAAVQSALQRVVQLIETTCLPHIPAAAGPRGRDKCQRALLGFCSAARRAAALPDPAERLRAALFVLERHMPGEWAAADALRTPQEQIEKKLGDVTGNRWTALTKQAVLALRARIAEQLVGAVVLVDQLRAYRHALAMALLVEARTAFADERRREGRLGFADLLVRTAALLRTQAAARAALGMRFARLIVDEFQDTDPVQAEICFLLAAPNDPETDWRRVHPEPGRLFVVGDPKQSIYRFRRADLAVYTLACARLRETGGAHLRFTSNFRSVPAIGACVDAHFRDVFASPTAHDAREAGAGALQASFAPLATVRADVEHGGVTVRVHEVGGAKRGAVREDAEDSGRAIAAQLALAGSAPAALLPSDVLVLAPRQRDVRSAAQALAKLGVPVAVQSLGDADAPELRELLLIVEALSAPTDATLVVAALMGPAAGASLNELHLARASGCTFTITTPPAEPVQGDVALGLLRLHRWWLAAALVPTDVLLARVLDETGLFAWAASGALGATRVGTLLALIDRVRETGRNMARACELLRARHERDTFEPRPLTGARGAVRVMTVHGAKGLEARLVHVTGPSEDSETRKPPRSVVRRGTSANTEGVVPLRRRGELIGAPPEWNALVEHDAQQLLDERARLRYVAATRARDTLRFSLVRKVPKGGPPRWLETFAGPFRPELIDQGLARELAPALPITPVLLPLDARPAPRLDLVRTPSFSASSVTERSGAGPRTPRHADLADALAVAALGGADADAVSPVPVPQQGASAGERAALGWGRTAHAAIEAVLRGRSGAGLERYLDAMVAVRHADDAPEVRRDVRAQLTRMLAAVRRTPEWQRLTADPTTVATELATLAADVDADGRTLVESGVVDAVCRDAAGWYVVDWKTTGRAAFEASFAAYHRQVVSYATRLAERVPDARDTAVVQLTSAAMPGAGE